MPTKLKDKESIEKIIEEMSVWEKVACITGDSSFSSRAMEKYGIPKLLLLDGGTGFNTGQMLFEQVYQEYAEKRKEEGNPINEEDCTGRLGGMEIVLNDPELLKEMTKRSMDAKEHPKELGCYPPGILFGATWDPEVISACGHALGKEAGTMGIDVLLGSPNVNIHRDPLNGRLFEGYSEDPCLVSKLAPSFVKAIQDEGLLANVKHFAANNQETDRMGVNEMIPERALREIYFPGFKACVEAGCKTVMSAYNKINGVPCAHNRWLLHDVLREEWGFTGCVTSDWSGAYDQTEACAAENDLVMPGPRHLEPVVKAVEEGRLSEEDLNTCVRNYLNVVLESPSMKGRNESFDMREGIEAAYKAALSGIVLLKNNGLLPFTTAEHPAFFGKYSKHLLASGAGSAAVVTSLVKELYECAEEIFGSENVTYEEVRSDTTVLIATVGSNGQEGADRSFMRMNDDDRESLDKAIRLGQEHHLPVVVLMNIAGPVEMKDWVEDVDAVMCLFLPGMMGAKAAMDLLTGKVSPSGKLPITFPKEYRDTPTYGNFPGYNEEVWYGEGIYVGYRYYEKKNVDVQYPFGYGLSYTSFEITDVQVPQKADLENGDLPVYVTVKNTGERDGAEVVQIYVHDPVSVLDKPVKELKGFKKVFLKAGEEKEVELILNKQDFSSYDVRLGTWVCEPGEFVLCVGTSSADIARTAIVEVECDDPYELGPATDIVKVVSDPEASAIVQEIIGVSLKESAGSYIVFQPRTTFAQVWKDCLVPQLKLNEEDSVRLEKKIYQRWKEME